MIADEDGYILALHVNAYTAHGVSFRLAECSVANGLLKISPDFLSEKKPRKPR